jgi:hypothetical protein
MCSLKIYLMFGAWKSCAIHFCCTVYKFAVGWMLWIALRIIKAPSTPFQRKPSFSGEKGTSKVVNINIKTSTEPGDGSRRKQHSATIFNPFKIKPFLTNSQKPRRKSYVWVQLRCKLDFSFKRKVLRKSLLLQVKHYCCKSPELICSQVLIKNHAFWETVFLLTDR